MVKRQKSHLSEADVSSIIEMAWEDQTSFENIAINYDYTEKEVIYLMKKNLKVGSYRQWRQRVSGRKSKHIKKLQAYA